MTKARDIASAAPAPSTVSATELGYLDGVSSAIQTQIDGKQAANANVSTTELGYLDGVTSAIQTQLDAKVAKSLVDAKGDLLVGSANDTVSRLAVASTAGYVLTVDSAEATGVKWAAVAAGGKVLQVVYASTTTETTNNTTTYADTTLTANITPSSTSSRVLVMVVQGGCTKDAGSASAGFDMQVRRGSTGIGYFAYNSMKTSTAFSMRSLTFPMNIVDSPATTSSLTYKTQFRNMVSDSTVTVQSDGLPSTIVLLEIGA